MRTMMLLVKRNLQEKKIYSLVIMLLALLSSLCLMTAFGTIIRTQQIYDEVTKKTNSPQMLLAFETSQYDESYIALVKNNKEVKDVFVENYIYSAFRFEDKDTLGCFFIPYNPKLNIYSSKYDDKNNISLSSNEILLPSSMQDTYNIKQNDIIQFKVGNNIFDYTVKDFIEDPFFGSSISTSKRIYISDEEYERIKKISKENPILNYKVLSVYINEKNSNQNTFDSIYNQFTGNKEVSWSVDEILLKSGNILLPTLIAVIFIIFSVFLFIITALILRYAILETVESDYVKMGVFKALGISNSMIIISCIIRYIVITFIGTLVATILSFYTTPIFGNVILSLSGLWWTGNVSFSVVIISIFITLFLILLVVSITSLKILNISPVKAIYLGKDFSKKGAFSVDIAKLFWLPLDFRISVKQLLSKLRQYSTLIVISMLFSFLITSTGTLAMFFNDKDEMVNFLGFDSCDILLSDTNFIDNKHESLYDLASKISNDFSIERTIGFESVDTRVNDHAVTTLVYDSFSENCNINLLDGHIPKRNNEITITPTIRDILKVDTGDIVKIAGDSQKDYNFKVVGIHQSVEDMGNNIKMLSKGYQKIKPEFVPAMAKMYLEQNKKSDKEHIIADVQNYNSNIIVSDGKETYIDTVDIVQQALIWGTILMIIVSLIMICLSTLLLSTITIARERLDNGILKAIGYTTIQLRLQLVLRFMLISVGGAILGSIISISIANLFFTTLFNSIGISKIELSWNPMLIVGIVMIIGIVTMASSYCLSSKIRKIKVTELTID